MINKRFDEIEIDDIDHLVQEAIREGRTLEYKEFLPGNSDNDKKEFLADVSAFANGAGGDLIYGVSERRDEKNNPTGIPQAIVGLEIDNIDGEIRRLDNIIRDGIDPRIIPHIQAIEGLPSGPVLIIRVPNSFNSPHMVVFKNTSRFYSRNSAGKYQLDVQEIRAAFSTSEALPERIKQFRHNRLEKIIAGETPFPLLPNPQIVLHVIPITSFTQGKKIDIAKQAQNQYQYINPIDSTATIRRYNFEGFVTGSKFDINTVSGYLLIFRNGVLEAVDSYIIQERDNDGGRVIPIVEFEGSLIVALKNYLKLLQALTIEPPVLVMLSLMNVGGYYVPVRSPFTRQFTPIERDYLILPDVIVENLSERSDIILRPLFDTIWQSSGYEGCPNYDKEGHWEKRIR